MALAELTTPGLHDFVVSRGIEPRLSSLPGRKAVDLGAGSGALALRLRKLGLSVLAVDRAPEPTVTEIPWRQVDLDRPGFSDLVGPAEFSLVTAIEVIEHLESPIAFLREIRRLLAAGGVAILTTPNVDNVPARMKFALSGRIRMIDSPSDPNHISPIFAGLFTQRYLPRVRLRLAAHLTYPPDGYIHTRRSGRILCKAIARLLRGPALFGDNHIFVLESVE